MTITLIPSTTSGRACSHVSIRRRPSVGARLDVVSQVRPSQVCAPVHALAPNAFAPFAIEFDAAEWTPTADTTTDMNPWLGGDVRGSISDSKYGTKRINPGRLAGMT